MIPKTNPNLVFVVISSLHRPCICRDTLTPPARLLFSSLPDLPATLSRRERANKDPTTSPFAFREKGLGRRSASKEKDPAYMPFTTHRIEGEVKKYGIIFTSLDANHDGTSCYCVKRTRRTIINTPLSGFRFSGSILSFIHWTSSSPPIRIPV